MPRHYIHSGRQIHWYYAVVETEGRFRNLVVANQ